MFGAKVRKLACTVRLFMKKIMAVNVSSVLIKKVARNFLRGKFAPS